MRCHLRRRSMESEGRHVMTRRYEYKVIDTGKHLEDELNALGRLGWLVVGVTTKKQLFIAPPQAIILMREVQPEAEDG